MQLSLWSYTVAVTTTHATQTATEVTIAPAGTLIARCHALRNRLQTPRSQATQDNFLSGATVAVTTTHATQTATEETIAPTDNLISRCRALRNRLQPPRSHVTQDTAEEPTITTANTFSSLRAPSATDSSTRDLRRRKHTRKNRPIPP
jgi:hypothetical protein